MSKSFYFHLNRCSTSFFGVATFSVVCACFAGCGPADSVYHDGNFTEEQKAAALAESQSVDDEESQGSKKRKPAKK